MEKLLFQEIPAEERESMLDANCLRTEEMNVKDFFTDEDLIAMRKEYSDNAIIIGRKNEELRKFKQEIDAIAKPLADQNQYLINNIRNGFVESNKQVYLFDDQEEGSMYYFDNKGVFLESRRLMPHEKQTRIK